MAPSATKLSDEQSVSKPIDPVIADHDEVSGFAFFGDVGQDRAHWLLNAMT